MYRRFRFDNSNCRPPRDFLKICQNKFCSSPHPKSLQLFGAHHSRHPRQTGFKRTRIFEKRRFQKLLTFSCLSGEFASFKHLPLFVQYPISSRNAPVAQLDRVAPSEGVGRTFESSRVRHFLICVRTRDAIL